jgi:hypothetical protein
MIRCDHLILGEQMVKCTKRQIRELKTALRWKIPAAQRQRIQMVLLRESDMTHSRLRISASRDFVGKPIAIGDALEPVLIVAYGREKLRP